MRRSMVLKDEKNRPSGYLLASNGEVVCKAKITGQARAVLFFEDGTQQSFELPDTSEQRISCPDRQITGCCVVCGSAVLASDDVARCTYASSLMRREQITVYCTDCAAEEKEAEKESEETVLKTEHREMDRKLIQNEDNAREGIWQQRRWPPPPCWEGACYQMGRWQDMAAETTEKAAFSGG